MSWVVASICAVASIPAGLRWLRIAQREHYLAPSVSRFALRWWTHGPANIALLLMALAGVVGSFWTVWAGLAVALAQVGPLGLGLRGVTSPLAWTARLRRLAVIVGSAASGLFVAGAVVESSLMISLTLFALPLLVDLALILLGPVERVLGSRWVAKAARKLEAVGADVVAITGSYGKTTTKNYVAHLLAGSRRTVASPASFNNRMGLARAINENLTPGTEVFVAEMGTYGPGEIAELCAWIPPKVAAMVSIGPVHLERFRTEERIVAAKAEILERAGTGVIAVDHPLLSQLARERAATMNIVEVSTGDRGRVRVIDAGVFVDGERLGPTPDGVFTANLAVAIGVCLGLGVEPSELTSRLYGLPVAEHRQSVTRSEAGFAIIDDTFNSNPAGASLGLKRLAELGALGQKAVVTPGMVELGPAQHEENRRFGAAAAETADHIVIVGGTNRRALLEGAGNGRASVTVVDSRDEAVAWVRHNLGPGDAVLYENDLPDHYP